MIARLKLNDAQFVQVSMWCAEFAPSYRVSYVQTPVIVWGDASWNIRSKPIDDLLVPKYDFAFDDEEEAVMFKLRWCDE